MAKASTTIYVCENCGNEQTQWSGKCPMCQEWNTLREVRGLKASKGPAGRQSSGFAEPLPLADVPSTREIRSTTGIGEFDRTLGGGIVDGSVILIGGEPGIGKSTLLMQLSGKIGEVLYVSGEESASQIKLRAERLGVTGGVQLLTETDVTVVCDAIQQLKPKLAIIDSIQTLYDPEFPSTPGSIVQVRECALRVQQTAKSTNVPTVLVGHVTKEGGVAGPRTLEHLVDVVLYLEGERHHEARVLRTVKNRFGATDEIGIFEMRQEGLVGVDNPSSFLLAERRPDAPGSVIGVTLEGTRPLLVEVQSLTTTTGFGYPKRTASGFDLNRLNLLIAVLQKRANVNLSNQDVYVNIAGGLAIKEPALDLAVAVSLVSAYKGIPVPKDLAVYGEVGLSGEIRSVSQAKTRESEATRLGYPQIIKAKTISEVLAKIFRSSNG
jgi:DNA repair protein RadA/Sms